MLPLQASPDQQQAVSRALDLVREDRQATLNQYSAVLAAQLDLLKQTFAAQHEEDLAALRRSNRFTLAVAGVVLGALVLGILFIALVPVRAMHRLALTVSGNPSVQVLLHSHPPALSADGSQLFAIEARARAGARLQGAVERLEKRLLVLESVPPPPAAHPAPTAIATPPAAPLAASAAPVARKRGWGPQVALTLGAGEALTLLPKEVSSGKFRSMGKFLAKLKKSFQPARSAKVR